MALETSHRVQILDGNPNTPPGSFTVMYDQQSNVFTIVLNDPTEDSIHTVHPSIAEMVEIGNAITRVLRAYKGPRDWNNHHIPTTCMPPDYL